MTNEEQKTEEQRIIAIKPSLFDLSEKSSITQYGFLCDSGWLPAIADMVKELAELDLPSGFNIAQVKEKWSELKVNYYPRGIEKVDAILERYRLMLETVCESCGGYAELKKDNGFYRVRCDACEAAWLAERQKE